MSYDIHIGSEGLNYTSNLAPLFYDHIPASDGGRGGLHELHGKTGRQAAEILASAFERIHTTYIKGNSVRAFRSAYDAGNGWGSTDGALIFLARIMADCHRYPRKKVVVCA